MYLRRAELYDGNTEHCRIVQEVDFLTGQADITEFFQYVMSSRNGFSETEVNAREEQKSPVGCIIVLSFSFQLRVRHKQVVDVIPLMGKCSLISNAERLVRFPIKASIFCPDRVFGSFDYSHEFPKHQGRI
jgi:hypothetical protein